ncbi:MAG: hypothetical protein HYV28_19040 [Ignavibacteriales bacterium]|nr:hypothetical protein [Ignavibacteriales bacterium]
MKTLNLNDLRTAITNKINLFIFSASFEDRCLSIASNIDFGMVEEAVVFMNEDQVPFFKQNEVNLIKIVSCVKYSVIKLHSEKPIENAKKILDFFSRIEKKDDFRLAIDITTFTHETLLVLYRIIFLSHFNLAFVDFWYNNAEVYSYLETDNAKKWLSVGNKEIRSIFGYSGFMSPLKRDILVVLVGFEPERTQKLINTFEPSEILLGVGSDSCTDDNSAIQLNRMKHHELVQTYMHSRTFEFPVTSFKDSKSTIERELIDYTDFNIIIAPMNNKITSLAVAQFAIEHSDVQLCYVPAAYYNHEGYSKPGSKCRIFQNTNI